MGTTFPTGGSQPFSLGPHSSHLIGEHDSLAMTYSGPYTVQPSLPFAVPTYSQARSTAQGHTVPPMFATTTTTSVTPPNSSFPLTSQHIQYPSFHSNIGPIPYMPQHLLHTPYVDPNLPTMKQMRLEFSVFSGGDPVEWLNKA